MTDTLNLARRFRAVGRLLQVQPDAQALVAFDALHPDAAGQDLAAVEQDYLRLFVGLGTPLAPPWESAWANDARLIFQAETLDVRYWYRSAGLQVGALHREPDDHLGYELEFIGLLLERGDTDTARAFAHEHPCLWAGRWRDAVEEHARAAFHPALAQDAYGLLAQLG